MIAIVTKTPGMVPIGPVAVPERARLARSGPRETFMSIIHCGHSNEVKHSTLWALCSHQTPNNPWLLTDGERRVPFARSLDVDLFGNA